jgi:hypothetical protein
MRNHVDHLLTAYVHKQLSRTARERVAVHVRLCEQCRAALYREEQLARDITLSMPLVGQPQRNQLARLWPKIWAEFLTSPGRKFGWLPSYGLVLVLMVLCAFAVSSLFGGPTHAIAAPFQAVPAEVRATNTPVRTDEPTISNPQPSETASVFSLPTASPAPHAGVNDASGINQWHGR